MDIYQIFITHNRMWSGREIVCFSLLVMVVLICVLRLLHDGKMKTVQAVAVILLVFFLGIVFASTVFTRSVGYRQYELIPFWSWREVVFHHDRELLQENLLNCILLFPMGILLPLIRNHRVRPVFALLAGGVVSFCIEISQLIFLRGLFEWDDMIHNAVGCMIGCMVCNFLLGSYHRIYHKMFHRKGQR